MTLEPGADWLNLTIEASSDRCCQVKFAWSLDGQELALTSLHQPPYSYRSAGNAATLSIRLDGPEAEVKRLMGRYRCDVWHEMYSDNRTVLVDVRMKGSDEPGIL